jgi:endogenous inhibitor of DNA gyrase (YacG/DUF329 family)
MVPISSKHVPCPQCGAVGPWSQSATSPFCSERCKLLDLEGWVSGRYAIPGERILDPGREQKEEEAIESEAEASKKKVGRP